MSALIRSWIALAFLALPAPAQALFASSFDASARAEVYTPGGVYTFVDCAPQLVSGGGGWILQAECSRQFLDPLPPGWHPLPGGHFDRVNLGGHSWVSCVVIEFEDDRRNGRWWVLAECLG
jgi:hypothetical protein